jgi:paired amphipathic helix protein Sin3a
MLFQGNPDLIQGFNTFLPPGYHIQCSQDASRDATQITVTTPLGTITQTGGFNPIRIPRATDALPPPPPPAAPPAPQFGSGLPHPLPPVGTGVASRATTPLPLPAFHLPHLQGAFAPGPAPLTPGAQSTSHAASLLGNLNVHARGTPATQQTEFNHAIHYLNQIKTRFAGQPDTYKQFLEILQAYQKDQRAVQHVSRAGPEVPLLFFDSRTVSGTRASADPLPGGTGPPRRIQGISAPARPGRAGTPGHDGDARHASICMDRRPQSLSCRRAGRALPSGIQAQAET